MDVVTSNTSIILGLGGPGNMGSNVLCYQPSRITSNGVWQKQNPLDYSLPLFILQLIVAALTVRATVFILKFLGQPKVIAEIIGGALLGPSGFGQIIVYGKTIFPLRSTMVLDTMGNIGLLYFLFLVGVETDLTVAKRANRHAILTAIAGLVVPLVVAVSISLIYSYQFRFLDQHIFWSFTIFYSITMSVTAFPVLARVIADLKLFNSEIARVSTKIAVINDLCAWTLLALSIAWVKSKGKDGLQLYTCLLIILGGAAFVLFCFMVLRPAILRIIQQTPEGESFNEFYIFLILAGVMICGFITDAIGASSVFGAFVFGLIIPTRPLGKALIDKLEDFVGIFLLPLFYTYNGLKFNLYKIRDSKSAFKLVSIIVPCSMAKILTTLLIALLHDMRFREALSLGLLMNSKGLMEIIVLNIGAEMKIIDDQAYAVILLSAVVMTAITTPAIGVIMSTSKRFISYRFRTIQRLKMNTELKIVVCIHTPSNLQSMISLLEVSHPTKKSPIHINALQLVELSGRATSMLIEYNTNETTSPAINTLQAQSTHIFNAFENYSQHTEHVDVKPFTAISPYPTMHEDICNLAEEKRATLIILPFYRKHTVDGAMEPTNPAFRNVNQNVLGNAPCSVGILIDRGLGGSASHTSHHIAVIFIGGPDDREALAYGWRIAEHPNVYLTVIRFLLRNDIEEPNLHKAPSNKTLEIVTDNDREKQHDDEYINNFILKTSGHETILYKEIVVSNAEETVATIRSMNNTVHDLYIVGRGDNIESPITSGLNEFSDCPELGAIGDILASSDFAMSISVLVVQQYVGERMYGDGSTTSASSSRTDCHV